MNDTAATAAQLGLMSCDACQLLSRPAGDGQPSCCRRCGEELEFRHEGSVQKTWALVIAATICYFPAMLLPVLNSTTFGTTEGDTILGGVALLYGTGSWPLALVVLIASVMIPLGKLAALVYLLLTVQRGSIKSNADRTRLYRLVEVIEAAGGRLLLRTRVRRILVERGRAAGVELHHPHRG